MLLRPVNFPATSDSQMACVLRIALHFPPFSRPSPSEPLIERFPRCGLAHPIKKRPEVLINERPRCFPPGQDKMYQKRSFIKQELSLWLIGSHGTSTFLTPK